MGVKALVGRSLAFLALLLVVECSSAAEQFVDVKGAISFPERWTSVKGVGEGEDKLRTLREQTSLRVMLDGGKRVVIPELNGSFLIPNVPIGVYLLDVYHPSCSFESVVVEVHKRGGGDSSDGLKVTTYLHAIDKLKGAKLKYPLHLTPWIEFSYFQREDGIQILSILKNPLALMMLVSFAVMGLLPILQKNMDPEELQAAVSGGDDAEPAYQSEFMLALQSDTTCSR